VIKGFFFSLDQVLEGISCEINVQEPYFSLLKGIIFVSLIWGFSMFLAFNFFFGLSVVYVVQDMFFSNLGLCV
jgi:hypothetical protein